MQKSITPSFNIMFVILKERLYHRKKSLLDNNVDAIFILQVLRLNIEIFVVLCRPKYKTGQYLDLDIVFPIGIIIERRMMVAYQIDVNFQ